MNLILQAIKALFRGLEAKIPKKLSDLVNDLKFPTPDWNQNNPKADDYIANRPFYEVVADKVLFDGVITDNENLMFDTPLELEVGVKYTAILDGVPHTDTAYFDDTDSQNGIYFVFDEDGYLWVGERYASFHTEGSSGNTCTLKVIQPNAVTRKLLPTEFLPSEVVRSDTVQTFSASEKEQARGNIGAVASEDVPVSIFVAESVEKQNSFGPEYSVKLKQDLGFKRKVGTMVLVPDMPCFGYNSSNGFRMSVEHITAPIVDSFNDKIKNDINAPWANFPNIGLFYYTGENWMYIPICLAHENRHGFVKLSDSVSTGRTEGIAATPKAVKEAYDKAVEVESKAVLNNAKEFTLTSSTEGSTKKFKISVDDSGTITATEVTE